MGCGAAIPALAFSRDLPAGLAFEPFDYLFSIANLRILPTAVLALPLLLSNNFHDSLLPPRRAYTPPLWAIRKANRAMASHGTSWPKSLILATSSNRRSVNIAADDTAYTLDLKRYEAAIESFAELIPELAEGRDAAVPQDLSRSTYHGRFQRPPRGGVFS
jgi:polyketide synthase PksN